jgi:glycosyltransferase involved in cell wall biosynthesis
MKLLFTILGTYNSGGMERVLANKANYLVNRGYDIIIVTTDQKTRPSYFKLHPSIQQIDLGINYTDDLDKIIFNRGISYFKKQRSHQRKLKDLLFQIKPDITISMFDNDASIIPKIKDGSKKVLEIHFSRFKRVQYGRGGIWKFIDAYRNKSEINIVQKFDRFVVLTEEDKRLWGDVSNICVIPNANSFKSDCSAVLNNKKVLAIGRLDYQKGFDDLIKIWDKVAKQFPDWKLNIFGHGPLKNDYINLIQSLNLGDSVQVHKPTKDIKAVYLDHSILAMTSRYEGLPMVLLEAQVCGLPMVSVACKCGPRDIINDGNNGFLIPEGDFDQFGERLGELMGDKRLRLEMGKHAFENSEKFSENEVMGKWIELFNSVLK